MENRPSVLVLDDGELDNVYRMLRQLGADVVRRQGQEIRRSVPMPRDLLISAGRRTLGEMPELVAPEGSAQLPKWVCVHNQDFLPMRERMCEMGVHYLLQSALDEKSLQRFLIQLLRSGAEQRCSVRLPLGGEVRYRTSSGTKSARLVDLSPEGCQILAEEAFDSGTRLAVLLPPSLGGGDELELMGAVLRRAEREVRGGHDVYSTVIRFGTLGTAAREQLESIARGERIGTKITPLAQLPDPVDRDAEAPNAAADRRAEARHRYDRPVQVLGLDPEGPDPALGCGLSLTGVRLTGCPGLQAGAHVTVALYGAPREEPVVLDATVSRSNEDGEAALVFDPLPADGRRQLEKLLRSQPLLDSLQEPDADTGRTVIAEVRSHAT